MAVVRVVHLGPPRTTPDMWNYQGDHERPCKVISVMFRIGDQLPNVVMEASLDPTEESKRKEDFVMYKEWGKRNAIEGIIRSITLSSTT